MFCMTIISTWPNVMVKAAFIDSEGGGMETVFLIMFSAFSHIPVCIANLIF